MSEGAERADAEGEVLPTSRVVTGRAVGQLHAGGGDGAHVAQVRVARGAARAAAAGRHEAEHHVVTRLHGEHTRTHFEHHASALVATDQRRFGRCPGEVARHQVLIAVAHTAGMDLHQHFACLRRVEFDLLDAPRAAPLPENCSLCLHV